MKLQILQPLHIRRATGDLHLKPGLVDLSSEEVVRLIAKVPGAVRPVVQAGDLVEWLSPVLPKQQGEVLAIDEDGTFEVYHPLTEILCHLPVTWITRVLPAPTNSEEANTVNVSLPSHAPPLRVSLDDPTADARAIWELGFPDAPWPLGAQVRWVPYMGSTLGVHYRGRRKILLSRAANKTDTEAVDTLIHELVHLRGFGRHNATFYRVENECRARLGLPPMPDRRVERRARREEKKVRAAAALAEWQQQYGALPSVGDEVTLLEANSQFPAGVWGTIISVRGSRVEVRWGVTQLIQPFWHHGLRLIRPTGRKRRVKGRPDLLRTASKLIPIPVPPELRPEG